MDTLQKVILHTPARGTQTSIGIGIGIPRGVFPLGRLGFESSPLYSGRAFRQRYFLPAGNMGKEGILCGSWERMSFFYSRMQNTDKTSENCTHFIAFGFPLITKKLTFWLL